MRRVRLAATMIAVNWLSGKSNKLATIECFGFGYVIREVQNQLDGCVVDVGVIEVVNIDLQLNTISYDLPSPQRERTLHVIAWSAIDVGPFESRLAVFHDLRRVARSVLASLRVYSVFFTRRACQIVGTTAHNI